MFEIVKLHNFHLLELDTSLDVSNITFVLLKTSYIIYDKKVALHIFLQ
jgi:hypothetical protein